MTRNRPTTDQTQSTLASLRRLTPAELRSVTGGQEMEHGGRLRW